MTLVYKNYYDYFLPNYCSSNRLCVLPDQQMVKTGIDQPKLYVNVNKKLSNLYGHQKNEKFNKLYNELLAELANYPTAENCVKNVISNWFTHKTPRCNNVTQSVRNNSGKCYTSYKQKTFTGTNKVVCYSEPPITTNTNCTDYHYTSINIQKELMDCLPDNLKNNTKITNLVGELLKNLL